MPLSVTLGDKVFFAPGALSRLNGILKEYRNILLFVDSDAFPLCGAADYFIPLERELNIHRFAYSGKALPIEDVEGIYRQVKKVKGADLFVGLGGGTTIDIAKIISIAYSNGCHKAGEVLIDKGLENKLDLIFIPTTAGTGSEATSFAVVYKDKVKISIETRSLLPRWVVLDPLLLRSLPEPVLNSTILDALAQAVESIWAVGATAESRQYSLQAISLILDNVYLENSTGRLGNLLLGSHLAGKAINISKTTLSHSISYPMTSHFGIPHGTAVFLTLPGVAELNYRAAAADLQEGVGLAHIKKSFALIFEGFGLEDIGQLVDKLHEILKKMRVKPRLRHYGIKESDLEFLAQNALSKGRSDNNPRRVDGGIVHKILTDLL